MDIIMMAICAPICNAACNVICCSKKEKDDDKDKEDEKNTKDDRQQQLNQPPTQPEGDVGDDKSAPSTAKDAVSSLDISAEERGEESCV